MKVENTSFYENYSIMTQGIENDLKKESEGTKESSKQKDPTSDIWNKIEKLKKQLSDLQAKIAHLSSNTDDASRELLAQLNAQCGTINAQILALFEQLLSGKGIEA